MLFPAPTQHLFPTLAEKCHLITTELLCHGCSRAFTVCCMKSGWPTNCSLFLAGGNNGVRALSCLILSDSIILNNVVYSHHRSIQPIKKKSTEYRQYLDFHMHHATSSFFGRLWERLFKRIMFKEFYCLFVLPFCSIYKSYSAICSSYWWF